MNEYQGIYLSLYVSSPYPSHCCIIYRFQLHRFSCTISLFSVANPSWRLPTKEGGNKHFQYILVSSGPSTSTQTNWRVVTIGIPKLWETQGIQSIHSIYFLSLFIRFSLCLLTYIYFSISQRKATPECVAEYLALVREHEFYGCSVFPCQQKQRQPTNVWLYINHERVFITEPRSLVPMLSFHFISYYNDQKQMLTKRLFFLCCQIYSQLVPRLGVDLHVCCWFITEARKTSIQNKSSGKAMESLYPFMFLADILFFTCCLDLLIRRTR